MTPNKHYNSYKEGLDLEFLREYWEEYVEERTFERSKNTEESGDSSRQSLIYSEVWFSFKQ